MSSTIDAAGRVVIPKRVREAMGLTPGTPIDITFADGRIEIAFTPMTADVEIDDGLPVIVPRESIPPLTDDMVRATLEATRR